MSNEFIIEDHILVRYEGNDTVIAVPEGVTKIGDKAFGVNDWETTPEIKSIALPNTVKEVGYQAFANLKKLESYTAPAGITYDSDAFRNCQALANEDGLIIIDGIAMEYVANAETITVTEGTHTLRHALFIDQKQLKTVYLPKSLKHIGNSVFANCLSLEHVNLPDGVADIGFRAFYQCANLLEINLPTSLTSLGEDAFCGCKSLADDKGFVILRNTLYSYYGKEKNVIVPEKIDTIATDAFSQTAIMSITLPSTLKTLGAAFQQCKMLSAITIPEGVQELPEQVFINCTRLTQVTFPSTLKSIGGYAFSGCEDLTTVVIPDSVQRLGTHAFEACTGLKSVVLPSSLGAIESCTFSNCSSLERMDLPASITKIEYCAFEHCTALREIKTAATAAIALDESAFRNCPALADENGFTIVGRVLLRYTGEGGDVVIPDGVVEIAANTFREGSDYNRNHYRSTESLHSISLPASLKVIGGNAFAGCRALQSIRIPDSVSTLHGNAFGQCSKLTQIDIGEGITELPDYTFHECSALRRVAISKQIERIGKDVFQGCRSLTAIDVDEANPHYTSVDGLLFSKDKTELILCPGGKQLKAYVIPDHVRKIATKAFIDCMALTKIVIPETVAHIGDSIFYRESWFWNQQHPLTDIEVSPQAGSAHIGSDIFSFPSGDGPLVFPKLPISFVREITIKTRLGMGYCQHPERYEGEYAASYKKYVDSHEKAILKKAVNLKLADVEAYYAQAKLAAPVQDNVYKPNVSAKKLSDRAKVELLEEAVMKGTVEDVKLVLHTYQKFEITARALALAGRYRGLDFVKTLADAGATFSYSRDLTKYKSIQNTAAGSYRTEYYLMLVPCELHDSGYLYSPLCGLSDMEIPPEMEKQVLPVEARFEIAKYCWENEQLHASMDEMLFWAVTRNDLAFADLAMAYGADLNTTPPSYYSYYTQNAPTYLDVITSGSSSLFWNAYVEQMTKLSTDTVLPALERLHKLAQAAGKKLAVSQKLFTEMAWCDESLVFLLTHADISKLNQKKALELAVAKGLIGALDQMARMGWLANAAKREKLIEFAQSTNLEALAWLMDFKNRTVDVQAEAAKEEAKFMRELNEDPNSVTALKRLWSYKKLEDDTLIITSYKGEETDVVVPAMIGKAKVTVIGEEAFSASWIVTRLKNREARKKIKSITFSEGIEELQSTLDELDGLERVVLPSTLKKVIKPLASQCHKLKDINIPASARFDNGRFGSYRLFRDCKSLQDKEGYTIFGSYLYAYAGKHDTHSNRATGILSIPEGITQIGDYIFTDTNMNSIIFPSSLKVIGERSFSDCYFLTHVEIPGHVEKIKVSAFAKCGSLETIKLADGVQSIGTNAFADCNSLREVYIPASVKRLSKEIFGPYDDSKNNWGSKVSGICIHTQEGAPIVEYAKQYAGIHVVFDYDEAMKG